MHTVSIRVDPLIDNSEIFLQQMYLYHGFCLCLFFPLMYVWYIYIVIYWQVEIIIKRM